MKKLMKKRWMSLLLTLMICMGTLWSSVVPVYASMADEAMPYTMGETYRGQHFYSKYYSFTLKEKTHVSLRATTYDGTVEFYIYNSNGKKFLDSDNVKYTKNVTTDVYKGTASRTLS